MKCDTCGKSVYEGYGLMFAKAFPEMGADEPVAFWCMECVPRAYREQPRFAGMERHVPDRRPPAPRPN